MKGSNHETIRLQHLNHLSLHFQVNLRRTQFRSNVNLILTALVLNKTKEAKVLSKTEASDMIPPSSTTIQ